MTITKTSQGFILFELFNDRFVFKMHYIGYSLKECKRRFRAMQKEQIETLNLKR